MVFSSASNILLLNDHESRSTYSVQEMRELNLQEAWQQLQSAWNTLSVIVIIFLVLHERQLLRDMRKRTEEYDQFVKDCEKKIIEMREKLEAEYNERLEIIAKAKNFIWIKSEVGGQSEKAPPRSDTH